MCRISISSVYDLLTFSIQTKIWSFFMFSKHYLNTHAGTCEQEEVSMHKCDSRSFDFFLHTRMEWYYMHTLLCTYVYCSFIPNCLDFMFLKLFGMRRALRVI